MRAYFPKPQPFRGEEAIQRVPPRSGVRPVTPTVASAGPAPGATGVSVSSPELKAEAGSRHAPSGHHFSRIPVHPTASLEIQPKLATTAPRDRYEQEADRISAQVLRSGDASRVRTCACGGTCEKCRDGGPNSESKPLQTQRLRSESEGAMTAPSVVGEVLSEPGQPLNPEARELLEPRFGHDFSKLRVHAGSQAAEAAGSIGALAYTSGRHIVFGRGQYAPGTPAGQRLLAHELTHVLQQTQPGASAPSPEPGPDSAASSSVQVGETIQRQPAPVAERKKIKKIILDKQSGVEILELDPEGTETLSVMEHCNPQAGTYTAHVKTSADRPEQLDWVTDQNVGCAEKKGFIARTTEPRTIGTLQGVTTLEFEVRDAPVGPVTGESTTGGGGGDAGQEAPSTAPGRSVREIWRDISELPQYIQEALIDPKAGRMATAEVYESLLRIGRKLLDAGVTADELFEFKQTWGRSGSYEYAEFEANIDRYLVERANRFAAREQNITSREKFRAGLFGREALYKRYVDLKAKLKKTGALLAVAGTTVETAGVSPDLIKERDELQADLIQAGFPGGIPEFEQLIQNFEASFERETLALAFDLIRKYDYLLSREYAQFEGGRIGETSKAAKLLTSLGKVRDPAQELYDLADKERSLAKSASASHRGVKGETWEGDHVKAAALRRQADQHQAEADQLVAKAGADLPVIEWPDFPREKLVGRTTVEDVRYEVAWYLATHQAAVLRARKLLQEKRTHIYELDNLLALSYSLQDIEQGSLYDLIIQNRKSQIAADKSAREILMAVIAIALAIVSFGGGTVGLIAAGAAFGISAAQAVTALEEYDIKTTLYMAQLLKDEPSVAWAILAVVGAGLDAGAVVQAMKAVVPAAKAFNATSDLAALEKGLAGVEEQVSARVMRAAEQSRVAEQQLKAATQDLKSMFTSPGAKMRGVGIPGGEFLGNLVAISYYYLKSRVLRSFDRFIRQLESEGLIVWAKLSQEDQQALRQAFDQALELSNARQLPFGKGIYDKLSRRAQAAFPPDAADRLAAQGKALGKTDQEIIDTLESEAQRSKLLEGAGEEKLVDPSEVSDVRRTQHIRTTEYDPTVGDSQRLGENLRAAERPKPNAGQPGENYQAHHIIPSNEGPQALRDLLRTRGLDINGEFNGIWLPTGKGAPNVSSAIRHDFLTGSQEYFDRISAILLKNPPLTRDQVIDKLRAIARYLDDGKLPPPTL